MTTRSPRTPAPSDGHLTHAELGSPDELARDCHAVGANLGLDPLAPGGSSGSRRLERAARAAMARPPSLRYEDYPREVPKRGELRVSDAAVRLAGALHLHLD
jgi:hypothetical protein